jgi:hypothetical protein
MAPFEERLRVPVRGKSSFVKDGCADQVRT